MHFGTDKLHMKLLLFLIYVSDHRAFSQGTLNGCSDYLKKKTRWGERGRRTLCEVPFSLITLSFKDSALQQIVKAPVATLTNCSGNAARCSQFLKIDLLRIQICFQAWQYPLNPGAGPGLSKWKTGLCSFHTPSAPKMRVSCLFNLFFAKLVLFLLTF